MPGTSAPSPTHVALVTCHDIRSLAVRKLTGIVTPGRRRDLNMRVDVAIDPASEVAPEVFVNIAVAYAASAGPLRGKRVSATFDGTIGLGQVFVRVNGYDEPVATVELLPASAVAA
jgi:hypothetical protein